MCTKLITHIADVGLCEMSNISEMYLASNSRAEGQIRCVTPPAGENAVGEVDSDDSTVGRDQSANRSLMRCRGNQNRGCASRRLPRRGSDRVDDRVDCLVDVGKGIEVMKSHSNCLVLGDCGSYSALA